MLLHNTGVIGGGNVARTPLPYRYVIMAGLNGIGSAVVLLGAMCPSPYVVDPAKFELVKPSLKYQYKTPRASILNMLEVPET